MDRLYKKGDEIRRRGRIVLVSDEWTTYNPTEEMLLADGWSVYEPPQAEEETIPQEELYRQRIVELVRERYTLDDEIAMLRQRDTKADEFDEYNAYAEQCKVTAREEIYGDEH